MAAEGPRVTVLGCRRSGAVRQVRGRRSSVGSAKRRSIHTSPSGRRGRPAPVIGERSDELQPVAAGRGGGAGRGRSPTGFVLDREPQASVVDLGPHVRRRVGMNHGVRDQLGHDELDVVDEVAAAPSPSSQPASVCREPVAPVQSAACSGSTSLRTARRRAPETSCAARRPVPARRTRPPGITTSPSIGLPGSGATLPCRPGRSTSVLHGTAAALVAESVSRSNGNVRDHATGAAAALGFRELLAPTCDFRTSVQTVGETFGAAGAGSTAGWRAARALS